MHVTEILKTGVVCLTDQMSKPTGRVEHMIDKLNVAECFLTAEILVSFDVLTNTLQVVKPGFKGLDFHLVYCQNIC